MKEPFDRVKLTVEVQKMSAEINRLNSMLQIKEQQLVTLFQDNKELKVTNSQIKQQFTQELESLKSELAKIRMSKAVEKANKNKRTQIQTQNCRDHYQEKIRLLKANYDKSVDTMKAAHETAFADQQNSHQVIIKIEQSKIRQLENQNKELIAQLNHIKQQKQQVMQKWCRDTEEAKAERDLLMSKIKIIENKKKEEINTISQQLTQKQSKIRELGRQNKVKNSKIRQLQKEMSKLEQTISRLRSQHQQQKKKFVEKIQQLENSLRRTAEDLKVVCEFRNKTVEILPNTKIQVQQTELQKRYAAYIYDLKEGIEIKAKQVELLTKKVQEYEKHIRLQNPIDENIRLVTFCADSAKKQYDGFSRQIRQRANTINSLR